MAMFELVEMDPATGQEDQLIAEGSLRRMIAHRDEILEELATDWDDERATWPVLIIQPAAA